MTFVILMLILLGLTLVFSGVENKSLVTYMQQWIGGNATK